MSIEDPVTIVRIPGETGPRGPRGTSLSVKGVKSDPSELSGKYLFFDGETEQLLDGLQPGDPGYQLPTISDAYVIDGILWVYSLELVWINVGRLRADVVIGDTTVLNPDESPAVRDVGIAADSVLEFDLPRAAAVTVETPAGVLNPDQQPVLRAVTTDGDVKIALDLPRAPEVSLGATTVVNPDVNPNVSSSVADGDVEFSFDLPRAPQFSVGSVVSVPFGDPVSVTDSVTDGDIELSFSLPLGPTGDKGWSPTLAIISDGIRRVLEVIDWSGGEGDKPATGVYLGPEGFVSDISEAVNISDTADLSLNSLIDVILNRREVFVDPNFNPAIEGEAVFDINEDSNGNTIVTGRFSAAGGESRKHVARFFPNGVVDTTFNPNASWYPDIIVLGGTPGVNNITKSLIQPDGKVVLAQNFLGFESGNKSARIQRFFDNGSLDESFDHNIADSATEIFSMALQPDNKIIAVGDNISSHIVRHNADGSRDSSFNVSGDGQPVRSVDLQPDGKVLIAGDFESIADIISRSLGNVSESGDADLSLSTSPNSTVASVVQQSDGKILLGGYFTSIDGTARTRVARLFENGSLDTTFNPSASDGVLSIVQQPDGKIVLGGRFTSVNGTTRNRVARIFENGSLDTTFNPNVNDVVRSVFLQPDGTVLLGGSFATVGGANRLHVARVLENGSVDTTFISNTNSTVQSVVRQSDGKVLLGGSFTLAGNSLAGGGTARNRIARVFANGALDATFDPNVAGSSFLTVNSIFQQPDNNIVFAGGFTTVGGTTRNRIARVFENGDLDTTFDPNLNSSVRSLFRQSDGKILLGGYFNAVGSVTRNRIARLFENGDLDTAFDVNTLIARESSPSTFSVRSVIQKSDNSVTFGGSFSFINPIQSGRVARLESDGSVDVSFGCFADNSVSSVKVLPDGKFLIGGDFLSVDGISSGRIARLLENGSVDTSFSASASGVVESVVRQPDGKILIGGRFTSVNGYPRNRVARLFENGDLVTSFNPNADGNVFSVFRQSDGKIVLGGEFGRVALVLRSRAARIVEEDSPIPPSTEIGALENGDIIRYDSDLGVWVSTAFAASGLAFDDNGLEVIAGDNVQSALASIDSVLSNVDAALETVDTFGNFLVPSGGIILWSGAVNAVPEGWFLCDGSNGTPDLRDRFVVGAGSSYTVGGTGGANAVTLTTAEIPSHSHSSGTISASSAGSHDHTFGGDTSTAGLHSHNVQSESTTDSNHTHEGGAGTISQAITGGGTFGSGALADDGSHAHSFSGSTSSAGSHNHTISGDTGSVGSGGSHENRPPYYALAYIMKD
jgi:uncharacterized delta-60 repeat protein